MEQVRAQVSAIRGLPWKADVPVRVVPATELARRVREYADKDIADNRDEVAADETILKLLDLIPDQLDYLRTVADLLAGGVLGFYDDETGELFVKEEGRGLSPATMATLAHELTHALTDQHFGFSRYIRALDEGDRSEELGAEQALVEGDAELVRELFISRYLKGADQAAASLGDGVDGPSPYAGVPPYLVNSLLFPYSEGLRFVESRHVAGGFGAVDAAYRQPPISTEQILHPDRYLAGERPVAPALGDLNAAGCTTVRSGVLGEFDMREVLHQHLNPDVAGQAADGWGGDIFRLVRCGGSVGLVDRWVTASPTDADQLVAALGRWAGGWTRSGRMPDGRGVFSGPGGAGWIVRSATRVDLVLADDATTANRLAAAVPTA